MPQLPEEQVFYQEEGRIVAAFAYSYQKVEFNIYGLDYWFANNTFR